MKIAICDDEPIQVQLIESFVKEWAQNAKVTLQLNTFQSAQQLWLSSDEIYDIYLLDIQMPKMNGMVLAKKIRLQNEHSIIIFITGVIEYIYDGFNVNALNYLLKPIQKDHLFECLSKAQKALEKEEEHIFITIDKEQRMLTTNKIISIESFSHYLNVNYKEEIFHMKMNLSEIEELLSMDEFVKPHRSFIVNINEITTIRKKEIVLKNGNVIPIARGKWDEINQKFIKYHRIGGKL